MSMGEVSGTLLLTWTTVNEKIYCVNLLQIHFIGFPVATASEAHSSRSTEDASQLIQRDLLASPGVGTLTSPDIDTSSGGGVRTSGSCRAGEVVFEKHLPGGEEAHEALDRRVGIRQNGVGVNLRALVG